MSIQVPLFEARTRECPFQHLTDHDDTHCNTHLLEEPTYSTISEDSPDLDDWLAEIRSMYIHDVVALDNPVPQLASYIPSIPRSSGKLFTNADTAPPIVAIGIGDVVSPKELQVIDSLERVFGILPTTKVVLTGYAKDLSIENLWPRRHEIFYKLSKLGFYAFTSINYSIWDNQPHPERIINIKRSLLAYEDLQELGLPVIPHVYWTGKKTIDEWCMWLAHNKSVEVVALNLQTVGDARTWKRKIEQLAYFVEHLPRPVHFLITGAQSPKRIIQIAGILGKNFSINNGAASRNALAQHELTLDKRLLRDYSNNERGVTFEKNVLAYASFIDTAKHFNNYDQN